MDVASDPVSTGPDKFLNGRIFFLPLQTVYTKLCKFCYRLQYCLSFNRAILIWPWKENARTKQKQQMNGNRAIWWVYRTDTNARGLLVGLANARVKKLLAQELSRNQSIPHFDVIPQHDCAIEQCLFFGGKTKRPCFDLFIHWLIKQITNTYRNHFSKVIGKPL